MARLTYEIYETRKNPDGSMTAFFDITENTGQTASEFNPRKFVLDGNYPKTNPKVVAINISGDKDSPEIGEVVISGENITKKKFKRPILTFTYKNQREAPKWVIGMIRKTEAAYAE